ncbi:hypothetical protein [Nitrosococcus oceani]|nr:hypothetical protein [Nitrosococcus oceani]
MSVVLLVTACARFVGDGALFISLQERWLGGTLLWREHCRR